MLPSRSGTQPELSTWRPIFKYCRICSNVLIFFLYFVGFLLKTFDVFRLQGQNWGFLSDAGMFHFGRGLLVRFNLVDWETHFSVLQGWLKCFTIFFRFCWGFFCRLFMFSSCSDQFGDFWVMSVCLTLGGVFWYASIWYIGTVLTFPEWKSVFSPVIKCENISFRSVKISFIYDEVCFIILSTCYHALRTRYHMRYRIIKGNFYNIQQMTFFCAISDVLLFMLLCTLKGISTYLYHFQRVTTRYRQFYKKR